MQFFDVVRARRSIRKFSPRGVPARKLRELLAAANLAPSAGNLQAYEVYLVRDPALRRRLDVATGNQGAVAQAPVVLVFCASPHRSALKYGAKGEQLFCLQDATIACAYAQLAATALGLSSVWIGAVQEPEVVKELLQLADGLWPVAFLPLGYPAESPTRRPRRELAEFVRESPVQPPAR